jgi:uncharacterized protein
MSYTQEIRDWQQHRLKKLTADDGWTTLVGLFWLHEGDNSFGRVASNLMAMDYPGLPERVGIFRLRGAKVSFIAAPSADVLHLGHPVSTLGPLIDDADGAPTVLEIGSLSCYLLKRSSRFGIRVRDSRAATRMHFQGLEYFPTDERWRLAARFEPYQTLRTISIVNVLGMEEEMPSPGVLAFEIDRRHFQLEAVLEPGVTDYFVMFTDLTNGKQTYAAGRCLYVAPPTSGATVIDFNKAYNPPCCFSAFATCALPQRQNHIPLAIEAGELKYSGEHH